MKQDDNYQKLLPFKSLKSHYGTVVSWVQNPLNNDWIISLSVDKTVKLWSRAEGKVLSTLISSAAPTKLFILQISKKLIIPRWENTFNCVALEPLTIKMSWTEDNMQELSGHNSWILDCIEWRQKDIYSNDKESSKQEKSQELILTCSRDKTIRSWSLIDYSWVQTFEGHSDIVNQIKQISSTNFISGSSDNSLRVWDINTGETITEIIDGSLPVLQLELFPIHQDLVLTRSESTYMNIWNYSSKENKWFLKKHFTNVICMKVWKNSKIISGSYDHTAKIWVLDQSDEIGTLVGHQRTVYCVNELNNGNYITGSGDNTLKIWDCHKYTCIVTLVGHSNYVIIVEYNTKDKEVASAGYDGVINLWRL